MLLKELYSNFLAELKLLYNENEASVICSMVFEFVGGFNKSQLISNPNTILDAETEHSLKQALIKLKQHTPVQYVTGTAWFYNLPFKVTEAVLIPRPETEELVSLILDFGKKENKKNLLDIGCGSGCIPVSVKKNLPSLQVTAIDISEDALLVAKQNAATHSTDISWYLCDFLDESTWTALPAYDIIVSNPPYIPEKEKTQLDKNVTAHEPHLALFVPNNRHLIFYEKIAKFGKSHLLPGGSIFMETHELYAGEVAAYFISQGYNAAVKKDFYEKERMVIATHCH